MFLTHPFFNLMKLWFDISVAPLNYGETASSASSAAKATRSLGLMVFSISIGKNKELGRGGLSDNDITIFYY